MEVVGIDRSKMSPAELYISQQSERRFFLDESHVPNATSPVSLAQRMNDWQEQQTRQIYKREPYRYRYGTSHTSANSPTFRRIENPHAKKK